MSAVSYHMYRSDIRDAKLTCIQKCLVSIPEKENIYKSKPCTVKKEDTNCDYKGPKKEYKICDFKHLYGYDACNTNLCRLFFPVILTTAIALFGLLVLFLGEKSSITNTPNIFLSGMKALPQQESRPDNDMAILKQTSKNLHDSLKLPKRDKDKLKLKHFKEQLQDLTSDPAHNTVLLAEKQLRQ